MHRGHRGSWVVVSLVVLGSVGFLLVRETPDELSEPPAPMSVEDDHSSRVQPARDREIPADEQDAGVRSSDPEVDAVVDETPAPGSENAAIEGVEDVRVITLRGSDAPELPESLEHRIEALAEPTETKEMFLLDREGIRSAIGSVRAEIRECYESWLQLEEEIEGRLVLGIIVEAVDVPGEEHVREGRVSEVEIRETDFDHPLLQGCVANVIGELRFNAPREEFAHITYPFVFRLGANEQAD